MIKLTAITGGTVLIDPETIFAIACSLNDAEETGDFRVVHCNKWGEALSWHVKESLKVIQKKIDRAIGLTVI